MTAQLDLFCTPPAAPAAPAVTCESASEPAKQEATPVRIGDWVMCLRERWRVLERALEDGREVLGLVPPSAWARATAGEGLEAKAPRHAWATEVTVLSAPRPSIEERAFGVVLGMVTGPGRIVCVRLHRDGLWALVQGDDGRERGWWRLEGSPAAPWFYDPVAAVPRARRSRPCWEWCGRPGPASGCHPGSRYAARPVVPCLMCGREVAKCESFGGGVICSPACDHLSSACRGGPAAAADFARTWLPDEAREQWEERVAIQAAEGVAGPEVRVLVEVWRRISIEIDPTTIRRA